MKADSMYTATAYGKQGRDYYGSIGACETVKVMPRKLLCRFNNSLYT